MNREKVHDLHVDMWKNYIYSSGWVPFGVSTVHSRQPYIIFPQTINNTVPDQYWFESIDEFITR